MLGAGRKQRDGRSTWQLQGEDVTQVRHLARLAGEPSGQARRAVRIAAVLLGVGVAMLATGLVVGLLLAAICVALSAILAVTLRPIRALVPAVAYLGGEFQVFAIREVILRHRPPTANYPAPRAVEGVHETSCSFPSGHSVAVTAVLFAPLGTVASTYKTWWPWLVALVGSLFAADTRLVLGVHWFSGVTFGLLLGITWGVTVTAAAQHLEWADVAAVLRSPPRPHLGGQRAARRASCAAQQDGRGARQGHGSHPAS